MAIHTQLPIYKVAYDLLDVVTDLVKNMPRNTAQHVVKKLEADGVIHCQKAHGRTSWHLGQSPFYIDPDARDFGFKTEPGKNGGTVIRFGDRWRSGPGLKPATRGIYGQSPLANLRGVE